MSERVIAVCHDTFAVEPTSVTALSGETVFLASVASREVVVKFAGGVWDTSPPLVEARAYELATRQGAIVPNVFAATDDYLVIGALSGRSLWDRDTAPDSRAPAWRRAGEDLRAIHEVKVPGFGLLVAETDGVAGRDSAWCPMVREARESGLSTLVDAGALDSAHARVLERRYDELAEVLHACRDGRLLHGDLEGGHVFADDGRYTGIIDFGQAQAGDPHWDLARVTLWDGDEALEHLLDGYGRDTLTPDERRWKLPLYRLARAVLAHTAWLSERKGAGESFDQARYSDLL